MRGKNSALVALCCIAAGSAGIGCGGDDTSSGATEASTAARDAATSTAPQSRVPDSSEPIENRFERPKWRAHPGVRVRRLIVKDVVRGDGAELQPGDTGVFDFIGADYVTGRQIGSLWGRRRKFEVTVARGQALPGWVKGMPGMRIGGRRVLIMPPKMGFQGLVNQDPRLTGLTTYYVADLLAIRAAPAG